MTLSILLNRFFNVTGLVILFFLFFKLHKSRVLDPYLLKFAMTIRSCFRITIVCLSLFSVFPVYAEAPGDNAKRGEAVFLKFCAGCHGFDGKANYKHAPSFSLGDRLQKDDRELLQSVLNGKNNMPPWQDKLPVQDLRKAIAYLRLMHERYEKGEHPRQANVPADYYIFKPVGEEEMEWVREEVKN